MVWLRCRFRDFDGESLALRISGRTVSAHLRMEANFGDCAFVPRLVGLLMSWDVGIVLFAVQRFERAVYIFTLLV